MSNDVNELLLIHGGLADGMNAERFWHRPGIAAGLIAAGHDVVAPDRDTCPASWDVAADDVARNIHRAATVIAGSNGTSVALRLALRHPDLVDRVVALWPATPTLIDVPARARHLCGGGTIRGVHDHEVVSLRVPLSVMATAADSRSHRHETATRLASLTPGGRMISGRFPESPSPDFAEHLDRFIEVLSDHLAS